MREPTPTGEEKHEPESRDVERKVVEWLRIELEDQDIVGSDNFIDIGGHSLTFAKLNRYLAESSGSALDMKTTYAESLSVAAAQVQPATTAAPATG
ncbi:hypothetical protein [Streptomyces sp. WAC 04229]|uniref:hypothetical protein n=1 Tax=Streptomyces sp. WAC 04229 TaxID=2203206 RepID=UPI003D761D0A